MSDHPPSSPGHTTILAAVGRGIHLEVGAPTLLADQYAMDLAGEAGAALIVGLRQLTTPDGLATLGRTFAIRARFVEDEVERAAAEGVEQYVILGAGLDSFALRRTDATRRMRIYEVDRPAAQEWKRDRLAQLGIPEPAGASYVPVDFEAGGLRLGLETAGFDFASPAIVSLIAVIQYLEAPAIAETLNLIGSLPPGSRLVLTYVVPPTELTELEQAGLAWTMAQAEARGEPFHTIQTPAETAALLRLHGFRAVADSGPLELRRRYFPDQPDLALPGIERIVVATR